MAAAAAPPPPLKSSFTRASRASDDWASRAGLESRPAGTRASVDRRAPTPRPSGFRPSPAALRGWWTGRGDLGARPRARRAARATCGGTLPWMASPGRRRSTWRNHTPEHSRADGAGARAPPPPRPPAPCGRTAEFRSDPPALHHGQPRAEIRVSRRRAIRQRRGGTSRRCAPAGAIMARSSDPSGTAACRARRVRARPLDWRSERDRGDDESPRVPCGGERRRPPDCPDLGP